MPNQGTDVCHPDEGGNCLIKEQMFVILTKEGTAQSKNYSLVKLQKDNLRTQFNKLLRLSRSFVPQDDSRFLAFALRFDESKMMDHAQLSNERLSSLLHRNDKNSHIITFIFLAEVTLA